LPTLHFDEILNLLTANKNQNPKKSSKVRVFEEIPQRLWEFLLAECAIHLQTKWAEVPKVKLQKLANFLYQHTFKANGKTTFKEEFVTSGGIDLKEIDFKTMQSKLVPGLFFAGEVLNIDAVTGGFNFQAAWTCSYIAAHGINAYYDNLNPAKNA
jgi:predicted Rossmann fold flavoprotein